jgi:hypothetical protein
MRWAGHVARMWDTRNEHRILVGKPKGKPLRRFKPRWEDNIKINFKEIIICENIDWINLAQDMVSDELY